MLCVSSNHHTVHLFSLAIKKKKVYVLAISYFLELIFLHLFFYIWPIYVLKMMTFPGSVFKTVFSPLRKLSFSGEVSVSRFRLPFHFKDKDSSICAFGPQPDSVIGEKFS